MVSNGKLDLDYLIRADRVRRPVYRLCGGLIPMVLLVFTLFYHISKATGVAVAIPVDGELPSGLDARPVNLTCVAPERPEGEFPHTVALDVVRVFPKLEFEQPIAMVQAPKDDSNKWYVATRRGLLWVFENADDVEHRTVALDLQARIQFTGDKHSQQWGITSLAFHPQFPDRPYLYVAYNARQDRRSPVVSVVARFESMDNGQTFDANSETVVLSLLQDVPNSNTQEVSRFHHLGQIAFGLDGLLYIGFGNPGGDTAQDLSDWHGSILRIDIDGGEPYAIPPDNPFVGIANIKEEIYAYGFRNPWRFSFDRETGDLWVGDVGGEAWEEVDLVVPDGNYGWKIMEGHHCVVPDCDPTGFIPPVIDYSHEVGMDLRFFIPFESTNICNMAPQLGDLGIEHAALLAPGAPERSIVYQRISRRGPQQMPPFGTLLVDGVALEMFGTWILSEPVCSSAPPTVILEQHVLP
jgi:glucose/arabinose dehydrogenase